MDSCFALIGARQHSVAKICNASQEPTHINCKKTCLLYQVPYFELTCTLKHALPHHVSEHKKTNVSRLVSRKAKNTVDSCIALIGARQHIVAKICNTSQEPMHINCKQTHSLYHVPYFEFTCALKHALPHDVFWRTRRPKCHDWCREKQKINVAGQSQPQHLNIQMHGQYHALKMQHIRSLVDPTLTAYFIICSPL